MDFAVPSAYQGLWKSQQDDADTGEIRQAKHWAIRTAERVFQNAHLLDGGVGVGVEYPLHLLPQRLAALAARGGAMGEMVSRVTGSLGAGASTGAHGQPPVRDGTG